MCICVLYIQLNKYYKSHRKNNRGHIESSLLEIIFPSKLLQGQHVPLTLRDTVNISNFNFTEKNLDNI